jgi:predicted nicotinamide N-methyase
LGLATCKLTARVGTHVFRLRALSDLQHSCEGGAVDRADSSAQWSAFGHLRPSGRVLAEAMNRLTVAGLRILEVGCGLGLPSLVLKWRGADVTASDHHPFAEEFLEYNTVLNGLDRIAYHDLSWIPEPGMGHFDLIICSDVRYARDHGALLSRLVLRHAAPNAEVVIADPGRGFIAPFARTMQAQGFSCTTLKAPTHDDFLFRMRLLKFSRSPDPLAGTA